MSWKMTNNRERYINTNRFYQFWIEDLMIYGRLTPDGKIIKIMGPYDDLEKAIMDLSDLVRE